MNGLSRSSSKALIIIVCSLICAPASGQGWGEQASPGFRYSNQGLSNEVYRLQYGATALSTSMTARSSGAASASTGLGGSGSGQLSSQLNNAVQITNNANYSVSITGSSNTLSFDTTVNADQKSTGTNMKSSNSGLASRAGKPTGTTDYLNK